MKNNDLIEYVDVLNNLEDYYYNGNIALIKATLVYEKYSNTNKSTIFNYIHGSNNNNNNSNNINNINDTDNDIINSKFYKTILRELYHDLVESFDNFNYFTIEVLYSTFKNMKINENFDEKIKNIYNSYDSSSNDFYINSKITLEMINLIQDNFVSILKGNENVNNILFLINHLKFLLETINHENLVNSSQSNFDFIKNFIKINNNFDNLLVYYFNFTH